MEWYVESKFSQSGNSKDMVIISYLTTSMVNFIKTSSTLTNLLDSLHHWITSLDSKKSTDIIYIDFAKAFDSISHSMLILKLESYGLHGKLLSWITVWLSGRTQSVKILLCFSQASLKWRFTGRCLGTSSFLNIHK